MSEQTAIQFGSPDRLTYCFVAPLGYNYSANAFFVKLECGAKGTRTPDLLLAKEAFSQLNYGPRSMSQFVNLPMNQTGLYSLADWLIGPLAHCPMGLCGLEPQTLPLSEARSNQLS